MSRRHEMGFDLAATASAVIKAPPQLTVSQWGEEHFVLSSEYSAVTGRVKLWKFQRQMLDAFGDPRIERVSVIKSARIGYTLGLQIFLAHQIDTSPAPLMMLFPRDEDAEGFSKDTLDPMFRDIPALKGKIIDKMGPGGTRQTVGLKTFQGGNLHILGAQSPSNLRRLTKKVLLADEVEAYPAAGSGKEGNTLRLAERRTTTFANRKIVVGSTPAMKDTSIIEPMFELGDQRIFKVPCPECDHRFEIKWKHIKWDRDEDGTHHPETAHCVCPDCGSAIPESKKAWMVENGSFEAQAPFHGHASFRINSLVSLFQNASWSQIAREFLEAVGDPALMQVWVNTLMGETFESQGVRVDAQGLSERVKEFADELPPAVVAITSGVDVQADRVEIQTIGWTPSRQSYVLDYQVINGDPTDPNMWAALDTYRTNKTWRHPYYSRPRGIDAICIDSGYATQHVYEYTKPRWGSNTWAVKGAAGAGKPIWPPQNKVTVTASGARLFNLGVDTAKELVYARLMVQESTKPGFIHFPDWLPRSYFDQLTAEERIVEVNKHGIKKSIWKPKAGSERNEALDTMVYATAALTGLVENKGVDLDQEGKRLIKRQAEMLDRGHKNIPEMIDAETPQTLTDEELTEALDATQQKPGDGVTRETYNPPPPPSRKASALAGVVAKNKRRRRNSSFINH